MPRTMLYALWAAVALVYAWLCVGIGQVWSRDWTDPGVGTALSLAVWLPAVPVFLCGASLVAVFFTGRARLAEWERRTSLGLGLLACSIVPAFWVLVRVHA